MGERIYNKRLKSGSLTLSCVTACGKKTEILFLLIGKNILNSYISNLNEHH